MTRLIAGGYAEAGAAGLYLLRLEAGALAVDGDDGKTRRHARTDRRARGPPSAPDAADPRRVLRARRPDGGEEDADDVDVVADEEHVRAVEEAAPAEREHEQREVEHDGEHEVGHGDPEERLEPVVVRDCGTVA